MTTLSALLNEREPQSPLGFDVETDPEGFPICFSIAWGATIEQSKCFWMNEVTLPCQELEDATLVTHYGRKVDVPAMAKVGQQIRISIDTYAAARLKLWDKPKGFSLKDLCKERLGIEEYGDVESLLAKYGLMRGVPRDILEKYNRLDAVNVWRLWHEDLKRYFVGKRLLLLQAESAMMHILADMQNVGIGFDKNMIGEVRASLDKQVLEVAEKIESYCPGYTIAGDDGKRVLLASLLTEGQLSGWPKIKKGLISLDNGLFNRFASFHPVIPWLTIYSGLKAGITGVTTYANSVQADGRIHSYLDSEGSSTGRFSSYGPNLQNVSRTLYGSPMRSAFVARPGYCFLAMDYKTVQIVIAAVIANDTVAMEILGDPTRDFHEDIGKWLYTYMRYGPAAKFVNLDTVVITEEERKSMKGVNFGKMFSPGYPAAFLPFTEGGNNWNEAYDLQRAWYLRVPGIERWHKWLIWEHASINFTETFFGRKQPIDVLPAQASYRDRARRSNSAANHPVQGTEGDIAKCGLMNAWNKLQVLNKILEQSRKLKSYVILNVHDDTMFEVPIEDARRMVIAMAEALTDIPYFPVKLRVDVKIGLDWYAMEKYNPEKDYEQEWKSNDATTKGDKNDEITQ